MTLQRRITWALASLVALFVVAQGVIAYLSLDEQEDALVDEIVLSETKRLVGRLEAGEIKSVPGVNEISLGTNLSAWLLKGENVDRSLVPARLRELSAGPHVLDSNDEVFHVVVAPMSLGTLIVQYDAALNEQRVYQFGIELLIIGAACIGVGALLSSLLARLVVAPLHRLTARLARSGPEDSPAAAASANEEAILLAAFDRVRSGWEAAATRQREFAANIAHELRTPLTALRTDIELTSTSPHLSADDRTRLDRAMATIDAAASTMESLQALSSQQTGRQESVDLRALIDDAWESLSRAEHGPALRFVNEVPESESIISDRYALLTILRNLLRNAAEHAAPATCTVRRTEEGLQVLDNGPGIAQADLPFVFERYYRGRRADTPGEAKSDRGLGLAIAKHAAELNGWRLTVASTHAGTCFSLAFSMASSQFHGNSTR